MSEPEVDVGCPGALVATFQEELGPELEGLLETPRHREDVHEVARRQRLVSPEPPPPSKGERGPAVLFGAREVVSHTQIGEIGFRDHLRSCDAVEPGGSGAALEQEAALRCASGVAEKNRLRIEGPRERLGEIVVLGQREGFLDRSGRLVGVAGEDEGTAKTVLKVRGHLGRDGDPATDANASRMRMIDCSPRPRASSVLPSRAVTRAASTTRPALA